MHEYDEQDQSDDDGYEPSAPPRGNSGKPVPPSEAKFVPDKPRQGSRLRHAATV
jgi:hypothetical protein